MGQADIRPGRHVEFFLNHRDGESLWVRGRIMSAEQALRLDFHLHFSGIGAHRILADDGLPAIRIRKGQPGSGGIVQSKFKGFAIYTVLNVAG